MGGKEPVVRGREKTMKKILVVDDEENIRELYRDELVEQGFEVELAEDGFEALKKLDTFLPDLVTLDVKMPGIDGIEVLRRIREKNVNIPVLLLTAFGEFRQDFNTWASDAYIVKSANLNELVETVNTLLGTR
jgi:two-component system response regulator (stage 0 sporulation protein F)